MRIGTYEILRELGRGGMGAVYLARATGPGGVQRLVAIKRPHDQRAQSGGAEIAERFLEEARITAQVHHANVVGMHQAGADDEGYYLVFDYVEGESLGELVERARERNEKIPLAIAIRIVLDALAGLHAAHETRGQSGEPLGILHRDVSPQNLLVGRDGITRLTDFGIAKTSESALVTDQRYVRGKFAFMSPEYLQRLPVDRTLDIYAMGMTLHIALDGGGPWQGYDDAQLMQAILLEGVPRLTSVPEPLAELLATACRMDAGQRYQTARQMLEALEAARDAIGARATHYDVAEYLERVAGPNLDARREAIASVPAATPATSAGSPRPSPALAPSDSTELHWQRAEPSSAAVGPDTDELLRSIEARPHRSRVVYAGLAAVAALAAFLVLNRATTTERGSDGSPGSAAVSPLSAEKPPPGEGAGVGAGPKAAPPPSMTTGMDASAAHEPPPPTPAASAPPAPRTRKAAPKTHADKVPASVPSAKPFPPFSPTNPYR